MGDVFIVEIPLRLGERRLKKELEPYCQRIGVHACDVHLIRGRPGGLACALLTLPSAEHVDTFINSYGFARPKIQIIIAGLPVHCKRSNKPARDLHMVLSLVQQQLDALNQQADAARDPKHKTTRHNDSFSISGMQCGAWATDTMNDTVTVFNHRYCLDRPGKLHFRPQSIIIEVDKIQAPSPGAGPVVQRYVLLIYYHNVVQILTDSRTEVFFSLANGPKIYRHVTSVHAIFGEQLSRERVAGIDPEHEAYAGFSMIYKVRLKNDEDHQGVLRLSKKAGIPPINPKSIMSLPPTVDFAKAFSDVVSELQNSSAYPFKAAFQLNALVSNGILPPESVLRLLPRVKALVSEVGSDITSEVLRSFVEDDFANVSTLDNPHRASAKNLLSMLNYRVESVRKYLTKSYLDRQKERESTMAYVHRALITPTGVFFYGPRWEASNRVLRKYEGYQDYFLRVQFCEEDAEQFLHEPRVAADRILRQFLERLDPALKMPLVVAGRGYSFLGFSNSSLKSQSCWFMAPFVFEGQMLTPEKVIAQLGDFSKITTPGRYAARVGQAFSDTIGSARVQADSEMMVDEVERLDDEGKRRIFSDGVGKVSWRMVERIWSSSEPIGDARPTVFQIRYAGAKGVICLDPTLRGDKLCLRPSMVKFEGSEDRNIEICNWASRLPMFLNRPLIKVLEDLGVTDHTLLSLQRQAVNRLRDCSKDSLLAAHFLRRRGVSSPSLKLPWIFESLKSLRVEFWDSPFLKQAMELSLIGDLRDIKYRGRIPVKKGLTLVGVLDETKYLEEGEIFVSTEKRNGGSKVIRGRVLITRSPVHHPGDVQMVNAVSVPQNSPLRLLRNCVIFSQKGDRPLPSMLSGGDLDGDLYNIIYDNGFNLPRNEMPAEYPLVKPVDLGRAVTSSDVAKFFVDFIQNNMLGMISSRHLLVADQQQQGVFHPDCLTLAEMASVAVDFPKTGVQVDRTKFPRTSNARPDFMAPGPRVLISKEKIVHDLDRQENDDDDEFLRRQDYYPSNKILGKLYREIDEDEFLKDLERENYLEQGNADGDVLERLWRYMKVQTSGLLPGEQWQEYYDFAGDLRFRYENDLQHIMRDYSDTPWKSSLLEVEVFVGTIIGRQKQTKRLRELAVTMKEDYDYLVQNTIAELKEGGGRAETLGRCMACLAVSLPQNPRFNPRGSESFAWVVMSVLMSEVDALQKETRRGFGRRTYAVGRAR